MKLLFHFTDSSINSSVRNLVFRHPSFLCELLNADSTASVDAGLDDVIEADFRIHCCGTMRQSAASVNNFVKKI